MTRILTAAFTIFLVAAFASMAVAQETKKQTVDPAIVKLMQKAAARQDGSLDTVTSLAVEANPEKADEIRALAQSLRPETAPAPAVAAAVSEPAPEEPQKPEPVPEKPKSFWSLAGWDGEVELSANRFSGNTDQIGVGFGADAVKEIGRWKHEFTGLVEYQRDNGVTTKQRYLAGYNINYTFNHRAYVFGNSLYENDRFGGFTYRISETAGLGYKVLAGDKIGWNLETGPGARYTKLEGDGTQTEFVGLIGSKFHWNISERSLFTHTYAMFIGSERTTIDTTAALKLKINGALSARISYNYRYNSNVPVDTAKTDTATKAALVYDF